MSTNLERLDELIIDTEVAITEQVLRIIEAEVKGRDTKMSRRLLKTLYGLLTEYRHARKAAVEAQRLMDDGLTLR